MRRYWLVWLSAWLSSAAFAATVRTESFVCPVGGERFQAQVVMSGTQMGMRLDFKPLGAIIAPPPVPECPSNGLLLFKSTFTTDDLAKLTPYIESEVFIQARKQHSPYYRQAMLQTVLGDAPAEIASTLIQASWEVEAATGTDGRYARYASEAIAAIDAAAGDARSDPGQRDVYQIVAADLERRLGRFDAALKRAQALKARSDLPANLRAVLDQEITWIKKKNIDPQAYTGNK